MKEFEKLSNLLKREKEFLLVGHKNTDGDCIGTMNAFGTIIKKLGKSVKLVVADPVPDSYAFLPLTDEIEVASESDCRNKTVILFECGTKERAGIKLKNTGITVNFDHHPDNTFYADLNIVNPEASSVGEMATFFIEKYFPDFLNKDIANSLYTAIHTDTGGFSYSNVKKETFAAARVLTEKGADIQEVCNNVYGNNSLNKTRLLGHYLENLQTIELPKFTLCIGIITLQDLRKFSYTPKDTENFANYPRGIKGVEVGIFILEKESGVFKVSMRSKGKIVVNKIASLFGGGGHKFAAGCTINGNLTEVLEKIKTAFSKNE